MAIVHSLGMHLKTNLVGTRLGDAYERIRWIATQPRRHRHPELWSCYLEPLRMDLVLRSVLGPDSNCLDGGCHVGSMLAQMVKHAPLGEHIAVEPVTEKAAAVARRFPQVRMVRGAISDAPGSTTFFDDGSGFASLRRHRSRRTRAFEVQVHTVDDIVGEAPLDLLKLDVEGAELWALRGSKNVLSRRQTTVMFECGPDASLVPFGYTRRELFSFLDELGYETYGIVDFMYARDPIGINEFVRTGSYPFPGFNYVAVPAGRRPERIVPEGAREDLFGH